MLTPPPGFIVLGRDATEFRGTLRCSCGWTSVDDSRGWVFFTEYEDGDEFHRLTFAACPAHHTLYQDPPAFYS